MKTWGSFQPAGQPLLGQLSVSGNRQIRSQDKINSGESQISPRHLDWLSRASAFTEAAIRVARAPSVWPGRSRLTPLFTKLSATRRST
ncbi:hypothetical protein DOZ80_10320 [Pseudomonas fluorescens]|uniref:Uncharacterized protein n=1 Tax=Pseudomonas fluorescens TaxID=294 RepID=A0A327N7N7_PSEFL|nr:hypothetical protein DOZ80_10320 [Pseudomonas fluorescens]